jgi:hypothetical protein
MFAAPFHCHLMMHAIKNQIWENKSAHDLGFDVVIWNAKFLQYINNCACFCPKHIVKLHPFAEFLCIYIVQVEYINGWKISACVM